MSSALSTPCKTAAPSASAARASAGAGAGREAAHASRGSASRGGTTKTPYFASGPRYTCARARSRVRSARCGVGRARASTRRPHLPSELVGIREHARGVPEVKAGVKGLHAGREHEAAELILATQRGRERGEPRACKERQDGCRRGQASGTPAASTASAAATAAAAAAAAAAISSTLLAHKLAGGEEALGCVGEVGQHPLAARGDAWPCCSRAAAALSEALGVELHADRAERGVAARGLDEHPPVAAPEVPQHVTAAAALLAATVPLALRAPAWRSGSAAAEPERGVDVRQPIGGARREGRERCRAPGAPSLGCRPVARVAAAGREHVLPEQGGLLRLERVRLPARVCRGRHPREARSQQGGARAARARVWRQCAGATR